MDDETSLLLPPRKRSSIHLGPLPKDRYWLVYFIFYTLGIAALLPWNFFTNAKQYFVYKLRNTTIPHNGSAMQGTAAASGQTELQATFENYLAIAAMVPNVVFMFLNTAATKMIPLKVRMLLAGILMILMFTFTVVLVEVNTDSWQMEFFGITLGTVVIVNAASAILQGGIFGLSGMFPQKYTQAVMGGMGAGGTFAALAEIVSIAGGNDVVKSAFGYFIAAAVIIFIALIAYLTLPFLAYAHYHTETHKELLNAVHSLNADSTSVTVKQPKGSTVSTLILVFKKIWMLALSVFLVFFVTLSCFPGVNSNIASMQQGSSPFTGKYFVPVTCFLLFNVGDLIGRTLAGFGQWPSHNSPLLPLLCVLRAGFIPLFLHCNVQPRSHLPVVFDHDYYPILFMAIFAISNGYLGTVTMMYGPTKVNDEDVETAGAMMSFFLACGLGCGAGFSLLLVKIT